MSFNGKSKNNKNSRVSNIPSNKNDFNKVNGSVFVYTGDITVAQLAKELKIGYKAACNLYDGTTNRIYFETLQNLCNVLDCTPNDIIAQDPIEFKSDTNK